MLFRNLRARRIAQRDGFTLVELLVVIAILAMLMGLLTSVIWRALENARKTKLIVETTQLHEAMMSYKEKFNVIPPSMAITDSNARKTKFLHHIRSIYNASTYGTTVTHYDRLKEYVQQNYTVQKGSGGTVALNLDNLDPAEALVFWLGGFPTPVGTGPGGGKPIAGSRLFGFNKDTDKPFKRSTSAQEGNDPLATRTTPNFTFEQTRLVDNDDDGWWEYLPTDPANAGPIAPYVYFDSEAYGLAKKADVFTGYPRIGDPQHDTLRGIFGMAVPLAAFFDPGGKEPTRWQNPDSFQIICPGRDGLYSDSSTVMRIAIFPTGFTYNAPNYSGQPANFSPQELDNITNLANMTLADAKEEAP